MIAVIATIEVAEESCGDFRKVFAALVPKVRAEDGCVEYGLWADMPTNIPLQEPVRPNTVVVMEKWESVEALEAHLMTPHMREFLKATEPMKAVITLQILESV
jgi:quinol monooxygenase YgiN